MSCEKVLTLTLVICENVSKLTLVISSENVLKLTMGKAKREQIVIYIVIVR
jgi:hypothetical protein